MDKSLNPKFLAYRVRRAYVTLKGGKVFSKRISKTWEKIASFLLEHGIPNALSYFWAVYVLKGRLFPNLLHSEKVYEEVKNFLSRREQFLSLELKCQLYQFLNEVKLYRKIYQCRDEEALMEVERESNWLNPVLKVVVYHILNLPVPDRLYQRAVKEYLLHPFFYNDLFGKIQCLGLKD